jgi:hypothetical protein
MHHDLASLAKALGGEVKSGQVLCPGPGHSAADRSLAVKLDDNAPDGFLVHSFANDDPIRCKDHVREKAGMPEFKANGKPNGRKRASDDEIARLLVAAAAAAPQKPRGRIVATYPYIDANGTLLYQVLRYEPKDFSQRRPAGNGGWISNLDGVSRVIYRLADFLKWPDATAFVTEGEKDADRLAGLDFCATTVAAGKWTDGCVEVLAGRDCLILEDNDAAGRAKALAAAQALHGQAKTIRIVRLPNLGDREDVSDWLDADPHRAKKLTDICFDAPLWTPDSAREESHKENEGTSTNESPKDDTAAESPAWTLHWHGEVDPNDSRPWLIQNLIPEVGSGLVSGQWGTYKTFTVFDLAHSIMANELFLGFEVVRPGGVLFIALEGVSEVAIRLQGVIEHKGKITGHAPFAWTETCPPLCDKNAAVALSKLAEQAAARLKAEFDLPLSMIAIDTVVAAAGYSKDGADNDAATGQAVMRTLAQLARAAGCFVFGVGHFGKDVSTGTRGSSAKEDAADVVLALLGDKAVSGEITNTRLAIRKRRGGSTGQEFPFKPRVVDMGVDKWGGPVTTLVLDWGATDATPKAAKDRWSAKNLRLLRQTIMNLMVDCGTEVQPWANAPTVRALDVELVKRDFYKSYLADGETEKAKRDARWRAFKRATDDAQGKGLIAVRELGGITYLWLVDPNEHDTQAPNYKGPQNA